jgi:hypothetical protein
MHPELFHYYVHEVSAYVKGGVGWPQEAKDILWLRLSPKMFSAVLSFHRFRQ